MIPVLSFNLIPNQSPWYIKCNTTSTFTSGGCASCITLFL